MQRLVRVRGWDRLSPKQQGLAEALLSLYLTTVYAYSGLQKLNPSFTRDTAAWLLQPPFHWLHLEQTVAAHDLWVPFGTVMGVNVLGAIHSIQACLPAMRAQR